MATDHGTGGFMARGPSGRSDALKTLITPSKLGAWTSDIGPGSTQQARAPRSPTLSRHPPALCIVVSAAARRAPSPSEANRGTRPYLLGQASALSR